MLTEIIQIKKEKKFMIRKMIALDWRSMKVYQIRGLLFPFFAIFVGWAYGSIMVIPVFVLMSSSFAINPFAVEDKGALNNFYLTLPVKRKEIVTGRYALSLLMLFCGIIIGVPFMLITNMFSMSKWYIGFNGIVTVISVTYLLYTLFELFRFPILFKLGYTKGRFWGFILPSMFAGAFFGAFLALSSFPKYAAIGLDFITFASDNMLLVSGGIVVLATGFLILSYNL